MISMTLLGIIGLLVLFILLAIRMPVALSMLGVGFVGTIIANANKFLALGMSGEQAWARGWKVAFSNLSGEAFEAASNYNLLVIPMFVLMGNLAGVSGLSGDLFNTAYRWLGNLRGGLASATIAACAGFAALSGSSLASAVTMGRVALPEMKKYKYEDGLATGSVAAGGTLGFLIPPSAGKESNLISPRLAPRWNNLRAQKNKDDQGMGTDCHRSGRTREPPFKGCR